MKKGVALLIVVLLVSPSIRSQTKKTDGSDAKVKAAGIAFYGTKHLLAATEQSMKRGLQREKLDKGRYIVALFGLECGECDRTARLLNNYVGREVKIIGLAYAYPQQTREWSVGLGLKYEVRGVGAEVFNDLGALFLPTILLVENGHAIGCRVPAMEKK